MALREPNTAAPELDSAAPAPVSDVGHDELLVVVIDAQGGVEQISAGCTRATGWRCEDLRGLPIWRTLFPHAGTDDIDAIRPERL